jgi:hypothetical protein
MRIEWKFWKRDYKTPEYKPTIEDRVKDIERIIGSGFQYESISLLDQLWFGREKADKTLTTKIKSLEKEIELIKKYLKVENILDPERAYLRKKK